MKKTKEGIVKRLKTFYGSFIYDPYVVTLTYQCINPGNSRDRG